MVLRITMYVMITYIKREHRSGFHRIFCFLWKTLKSTLLSISWASALCDAMLLR